MTPERWAEIDRVWHAVLARPEAERAAAVAELCAGDTELRRDVEALLANLARASAAGFGAAPGVATGSGSLVGTRLGTYTVHALLGVGGMGEVYQAHDSTLGREVALKILPDLWLGDPDRRARFDREARVLASLNHPNIGSIYGVQDSDGVKALVLELVEGETLADYIIRQPRDRRGMPIDEVTAIASQIIDALDAAHERGIVHRDLKPGNIKITPEGRVKVLDFGLARAVSGASSPSLANSPTITAVGTQHGVLLGTAAYMSPEQARGRSVDKRTDIWAFGCVLYEMLTGTSAFGGDAVSDVLAKVITGDPDWRALPQDVPSALRLCVQRCLQKDLNQRFRDIGDARLALQGAFDHPVDRDASPRRSSALAYAGWAAAALVAIASVAGIIPSVTRAPADISETRLDIVTPPTPDPASFAISPDGRRMVFAEVPSRPMWLRPLDSNEARALTGTEGGTMPFWSPDGQSIGFFAQGVLKRIDLAGGFARTLANAPQPRRGAWNADGTIIFGAGSIGPLYRVSADGGAVQPATALLPGQTNHRWPQFLPDGRRFLIFSLGAAGVRGLYIGSLADKSVRKIADRESAYALMPGANMLLFARQGALWAKRMSSDYNSTEGDFIPIAPRVLVDPNATGYGAISVSSTGSIAYRASAGLQQLVWLDRAGRTVATIGQPEGDYITIWGLSLDGRTAAVSRVVEGNPDVWLVDTERGILRRLTDDPGDDGNPVLSRDGSRVVYVADGKDDVYQIHERPSDGNATPTPLFESDENKNPNDWSPDGRYVLFSLQSQQTSFDLMALPMFGDRKPFVVAATQQVEADGKFSPDGRWVAYLSTQSGSPEVYVQPFPGPGAKTQVSIGGGSRPRWRRDGRELFYAALDNRLMAVPVTSNGKTIETGRPQPLFPLPGDQYEPSPDGQRFLTSTNVSPASPITVILNWKPPSR
jgi:serine/threonine protein kinase/Tol biopolymer transport system component